MSSISCHVLDTAIGRPAAGIRVLLERLDQAEPEASPSWQLLGEALTNADGRAPRLNGSGELRVGRHRITFETEAYFRDLGQPIFFPQVQISFVVASASEAYHIPLLLSPFGYSTYRGS